MKKLSTLYKERYHTKSTKINKKARKRISQSCYKKLLELEPKLEL